MRKRWGPPHGRTAAVDRLTVRHFVLLGARCSLLCVAKPQFFCAIIQGLSVRCSVAIASRLGSDKLQGTLPSSPATRRHQCRSRKLDNAAFNSEQGVVSSGLKDTLATSPRSCSRVVTNPCVTRTQPPVSRPIPHRTDGYRAGLSYTMESTNAIVLDAALTWPQSCMTTGFSNMDDSVQAIVFGNPRARPGVCRPRR